MVDPAYLAMTITTPVPIPTVSWLSLREAAQFSGKSVHTLKKLVQSDKILNKKVSGKYGKESRIGKESLIGYYQNLGEPIQTPDNTPSIPIILGSSTHNQNPTPTPDNVVIPPEEDDSTTEESKKQYERIIQNLENQISILTNELSKRNGEIERLQTIITNQQTLSLQQSKQYSALLESQETKETRKKILGLF